MASGEENAKEKHLELQSATLEWFIGGVWCTSTGKQGGYNFYNLWVVLKEIIWVFIES